MGLTASEAQEKFGFLLDAFQFGAPPHGGIAFGWDRICALLGGTDSIRDVIAFPKSGGGFDPLTAAPAPITPEQRKEAGVDAKPVSRRRHLPPEKVVRFEPVSIRYRVGAKEWPPVVYSHFGPGSEMWRASPGGAARTPVPASTRKVAMGISPTEMSEQDVSTEPVLVKQQIAGRSPTQIAMDRLKHDKIAMICFAIVVLFVLIAVFAPLLTRLFGVELDAGTSEDTDQFSYPIIGPPDHGFTWEAPLGLAPRTGNDNLAEWFYGARTSLFVATCRRWSRP